MNSPGQIVWLDPYPWRGVTCRRPDFSIHIIRDLTTPANPGVRNHSDTHPGNFVIHLPAKGESLHPGLEGASEMDCVLHELGHIVGLISNQPGALGDCRGWGPQVFSDKESAGNGIWNSEVEAWTLAETMLLANFQSSRRRALATYSHYRSLEWPKLP